MKYVKIYILSFPFSGNCTNIIAMNIRTQPDISRNVNAPPVSDHPHATRITVVSVAKTDSRLIRIEAEVGSVYF